MTSGVSVRKYEEEEEALLQSADLEFEANHGSTWISSAFILANITLGVGMLSFPSAYRDAGGIVPALTIQTVCVVFVTLGLLAMAHCSDRCGGDTYQDVVQSCCGRLVHQSCNVLIILHNFGACVSFLVILADQMHNVLVYATGPDYCDGHWYLRRGYATCVCSSLFILPFLFSTRIDSYKFISVLGIITTFYVLFLVVWKYFDLRSSTSGTNIPISTKSHHWADVFKVVPTICFSFETHIEAVPVYACLRQRTLAEFGKACLATVVFCVFVYSCIAIFGYLTFGDDTSSDLLLDYTPPDWMTILAGGILGIKCITTYPVIFFCMRVVLEEMWWEWRPTRSLYDERLRRGILTLLLFVLSLLLALLAPSIGSVISLLGGSAAVFILVYPGLCLLQADYFTEPNSKMWKECLGTFCVVLGCFIAGTTTVQSVQRFYQGEFLEPATSFCPVM